MWHLTHKSLFLWLWSDFSHLLKFLWLYFASPSRIIFQIKIWMQSLLSHMIRNIFMCLCECVFFVKVHPVYHIYKCLLFIKKHQMTVSWITAACDIHSNRIPNTTNSNPWACGTKKPFLDFRWLKIVLFILKHCSISFQIIFLLSSSIITLKCKLITNHN